MGKSNLEIKSESLSTSRKLTPKKLLITLLKLLVGGGAIYIILQKVDVAVVGNYMSQVNFFYLLAAFLIFFLSKAVAAFRINVLFRTQGLQLSELLNVKLNLLGMFYGLFIPLIGAEGYKVYWLRQRYSEVTTKSLIWASLLDRVSGVAALLSLAILTLQFSGVALPYRALTVLLIPLMFGVYYLIHRWMFSSFQSAWWKVNGYALIVQVLQVLAAYFILLALGVEQQQMDYLFIFLLASLAFVMPFIGAREMAFVYGASALGLDADMSLAISLFFYLALAMTSLCGIFFLLFPGYMEEER